MLSWLYQRVPLQLFSLVDFYMKVFTRKPVVWTSWTIVILILFTGEWICSLFLWWFPIQSNKKTFSSRRLAENLNRGSLGQSSFLRKWTVRNPEFPVPRSGSSIFYHVFTSDLHSNRFLEFYIKTSSSPYRPSSFLQESASSRAQRRLVFFSVPLLSASPITTLPSVVASSSNLSMYLYIRWYDLYKLSWNCFHLDIKMRLSKIS